VKAVCCASGCALAFVVFMAKSFANIVVKAFCLVTAVRAVRKMRRLYVITTCTAASLT
jgi:hypothetical protein